MFQRAIRGQNILTEKVKRRWIHYEIQCQNTNVESIVIDITDQGSYSLRSTDVMVRAVNLHYPERFWDARLAVTASKFVASKCDSEVRDIVSSFKVTPIAEDLVMVSILTLNTPIRITGLRVVRETVHKLIAHPDLLLHLAEVRDVPLNSPQEQHNYYHSTIRSAGSAAVPQNCS